MHKRTSDKSLRRMKSMLKWVLFVLVLGVLAFSTRFLGWGQQDFLTPEEREWLEEHYRDISVAPDPRWTPSQSIEEQQIYYGISSDFMALVERKLNVRFTWLQADSWEEVLEMEEAGKIDIHPVIFQTPDRDADWLFTDAYMRIPVIAVMRASLLERFQPEQIWGLRMSVGSGYGIENFLLQHADRSLSLIPVESDRFGLIKAALGEIDVMVTDLASASYYIEEEGLTNLRLAATLGSLYEFRFASRRELPKLHSILNKALAEISREERRRIYDRWIVFDTRPFYRSVTFWYFAGVSLVFVLLVIGVILAWNAALKVEVDNKTAALLDAQRKLEDRVRQRTAELASANAALESEMRERARIAQDLLHVSGNERARIGRDLHDSVGQKLVGMLYLTRVLAEQLEEGHREEATSVYKILDVIESSLTEMKQIVRGLLPVDVLDKGLVSALEALTKETEEYHHIDCRFVCEDEKVAELDHALATNLYRIAQEAISNALKHAAKLTQILVILAFEGDDGILVIENDGEGIAKESDSHWAGMGIKIMHYRAMLAGGHLDIAARENGGTIITCHFDRHLKEPVDGESL